MWKTVNCAVYLSYVSVTYRREIDGVIQVLEGMIWNDDTMTLWASQEYQGRILTRGSVNLPRDYILLQGDITRFFNEAFFKGESKA